MQYKGSCEKINGAMFIVRREVEGKSAVRYVIDKDSEHLFAAVMVGTSSAEVKGSIEKLGEGTEVTHPNSCSFCGVLIDKKPRRLCDVCRAK